MGKLRYFYGILWYFDDVNKRFTRILFHCSIAYKPRTSMTAAAAAS